MATCTSCGNDVTGKKFCPECGTPVQVAAPPVAEAATTTCPRCNGAVKAGASFCMHCGTSLTGQTMVATAQSQSQPLTRQCVACHTEVSVDTAFCTNCGQPMQTAMTQIAPTAIAPTFCNNCGRQNAAGVRFCGGCGSPLGTGTATPAPQTMYPQTGPYGQPSGPYGQPSGPYGQPSPTYPSQYDQPQYGAQYQQQGTQYPQQAPGQYGQMGYQQQPMAGQQPMVLHCPVCMAMSPVGTANCAGCHTNLAGVVPTPAVIAGQGQQGGGLGGMLQGPGGGMAMGALGGAAAVIGGEMLLHGFEREHERGYGYDRGGGDGLLGGLGGLANDVGLF